MQDWVLAVVVGARFLAPFLIPRFPLPGLLICFVLDAADQTIFQAFGTVPANYEGYDKAMDIFYLSMAYLAMLRNWTDLGALRIGRFLFYYRLIGAMVFEIWPGPRCC